MTRSASRSVTTVVTALGAVLAVSTASLAACSTREAGFDSSQGTFVEDASTDGPSCYFQCSLDGRSVVQTCTGEVVETCPPHLACGAGACQEPCAAAAADRSSNGCEFYLQPPPYSAIDIGQSCYAAYVVNTSAVPVEVELSLDGQKLDLSKALFTLKPGGDVSWTPQVGPIAPGESVALFVSDAKPGSVSPGSIHTACPKEAVPASYTNSLPNGTGFGSSFHLTTSAPVSLSAIFPYSGAESHIASATLLLPVATWGTEHIIVNAWEQLTHPLQASPSGPAAQIVASEDDTEITIVPKRDIQDGIGFVGAPANVPATYHLAKGQLLQINQAQELSGSIVRSNKPTSVFGGHECMNVPSMRAACDAALQQLPPFPQWGSEYVGVGYRPRLGNEFEPMPYRIVAARDGTRLDYDPAVPAGAPLEMSAGEVVTFWSGTGQPFVVRSQDAEHPFYLAAYMSSGGKIHLTTGNATDFLSPLDFGGRGDPEFVNVVPARQYLNAYSFFADPSYQETALTIVRAKSGDAFKDVWLECAGNLTDWKSVGTRGEYEFTRVDLARNFGPGQSFGSSVCQKGLQRMKSEGPFTATIWGWSQWTSYAYPGGQAQRKLVDTPLLTVH
ncbi:MAG: hypothetical protein BGO98_32230 [Myxococcales bacterium 68-20]|nr:MAG: hypothetical protein BGO98_32230 [Myxococcales bacterium 68-20]